MSVDRLFSPLRALQTEMQAMHKTNQTILVFLTQYGRLRSHMYHWRQISRTLISDQKLWEKLELNGFVLQGSTQGMDLTPLLS